MFPRPRKTREGNINIYIKEKISGWEVGLSNAATCPIAGLVLLVLSLVFWYWRRNQSTRELLMKNFYEIFNLFHVARL